MSDERLKDDLARTVLGWNAVPNRLLKSDRSYMPRWRFNPLASLEDAFLLLDRTGSSDTRKGDQGGIFTAGIRIGDRLSTATGDLKARATTLANAQARPSEAGVPYQPPDDPDLGNRHPGLLGRPRHCIHAPRDFGGRKGSDR